MLGREESAGLVAGSCEIAAAEPLRCSGDDEEHGVSAPGCESAPGRRTRLWGVFLAAGLLAALALTASGALSSRSPRPPAGRGGGDALLVPALKLFEDADEEREKLDSAGVVAKEHGQVIETNVEEATIEAISDSQEDNSGSSLGAADADRWRVVADGGAEVREAGEATSKVISTKKKCESFSGTQTGNWVMLQGQDGYIRILSEGGEPALQELPVFEKISQGTCADAGAFPVTDDATCEAAATSQGAGTARVDDGDCVMPDKALLCSSQKDPLKKCNTKPTKPTKPLTTTTVTTTTTWSFPSLFCYCVTGTQGPEPELVRKQIKNKWGIFNCDEYTVLSHGGKAWLADDWFATPIPAPEEHMGNTAAGAATSSWLNTLTFLKAWELIMKDYRFRSHDWTIKADPDAVIFPWRVKHMVKPYSPPAPKGAKKFFLNCNRLSPNGPVGPGKLYGAVEIYSRAALETFFWSTPPGKNVSNCRKELPWHTWGEDLFMQQCMEMLGIQAIWKFGWVADNRCIPGDCGDPSKVALHDFKDAWQWESCWNKGIAAEKK